MAPNPITRSAPAALTTLYEGMAVLRPDDLRRVGPLPLSSRPSL